MLLQLSQGHAVFEIFAFNVEITVQGNEIKVDIY